MSLIVVPEEEEKQNGIEKKTFEEILDKSLPNLIKELERKKMRKQQPTDPENEMNPKQDK